MQRLQSVCALLAAAVAAGASGSHAQGRASSPSLAMRAMGQSGLRFEPNVGQTDPSVKFLARMGGATLFITRNEAVLRLAGSRSRPAGASPNPQIVREPETPTEPDRVLRMRLIGAGRSVQAFGSDRLPGVSNYFIGTDPKKWRRNVPSFSRARLANVYPMTDLVYYDAGGRLEYDFILKPGADPKRIAMRVEGADRMRVAGGDLVLTLGPREIRWRKPVAYQRFGGRRVAVACRYEVEGTRVGFSVARYDRGRTLVVDPVLEWSTFTGIMGIGQEVEACPDGGCVLVGEARGVQDLPFTCAGFDTTMNTPWDAFAVKVGPDGLVPEWFTYIGGNNWESAWGIARLSDGDFAVSGWTLSPDLPGQSGLPDHAYHGGFDAFVTRISANGMAVPWTRYIGGPADDWGSAIAASPAGGLVAAVLTLNGALSTSPNAWDGSYNGGRDIYVCGLDVQTGGTTWATYVGSASDDGPNNHGLDIDRSNCPVVIGYTVGTNFPLRGAGTTSRCSPGTQDAVAFRLAPDGSDLTWSVQLGGPSLDWAHAVACDANGDAVVTGTTLGGFPFYNAHIGGVVGLGDAFVCKLRRSDGDTIWSTALGINNVGEGYALALASDGSPVVTGYANGGLVPSPDAFDPTVVGESEGYIVWMDRDGSKAPRYVSYIGGSGYEGCVAVAVTPGNVVYMAGFTYSSDFQPHNAISPDNTGGHGVFWAKLDLQFMPNHDPIAKAGSDQTPHCSDATATVQLNGSGSYDPDDGDSMVSYVWSSPAIGSVSGVSPTVSLPIGTHVITLTVMDTHEAIGRDDVTVTVVDTGPPNTHAEVAPEPVFDGWHAGPVTVTLAATDAGSGVKETKYRVDGGDEGSYAAPFTVAREGDGPVTFYSTDNANNAEVEQSIPIKIDLTAPRTVATVTPAPNVAGWNNSPVTITLTATDAGSGVAATYYRVGGGDEQVYTVPIEVTAEGTTIVAFRSVDHVGHRETEKSMTIEIDRAAPDVSITSPIDKTYILNAILAASYTCSDALSGVASVDASAPNGAVLDTSTPGPRSFVVTATDAAGNTSTVSVTYRIGYRVVAQYDQGKTHKSGSTIPIKVQVVDANGANLSSPDLVVTATQVFWVDGNAAQEPEDSGNANPDLNFRYTDGGYILNLSTKGFQAGTWELRLKVAGDDTTHAVRFKIR